MVVAVNERGLRIGESHPAAVLADSEVDRLRELRERLGWPYSKLAEWFGVSKTCVAKLCRYELRAQTPAALVEKPAPGTRRSRRKRLDGE